MVSAQDFTIVKLIAEFGILLSTEGKSGLHSGPVGC